MLNSVKAGEAFLVVPCSLGSGVEADLGEQPLPSCLGSGDNVISDGLPLCIGTSYFPHITSLQRSTNALAEWQALLNLAEKSFPVKSNSVTFKAIPFSAFLHSTLKQTVQSMNIRLFFFFFNLRKHFSYYETQRG